MFNQDLAQAKVVECFIASNLCGELSEGYFTDYDLKIEIKQDKLCHSTGNVAFEIRYKGQPSGISSTKATKIIYELAGKYWICDTEKLKEHLKSNNYKRVNGGDGNQSELILMPLFQFITLFKEISF